MKKLSIMVPCYNEEENVVPMSEALVAQLEAMPESKPDADFYYVNDDFDKVHLYEGEFAIIFPEEAHAPEIAVNETPCEVKKIVLKVLY